MGGGRTSGGAPAAPQRPRRWAWAAATPAHSPARMPEGGGRRVSAGAGRRHHVGQGDERQRREGGQRQRHGLDRPDAVDERAVGDAPGGDPERCPQRHGRGHEQRRLPVHDTGDPAAVGTQRPQHGQVPPPAPRREDQVVGEVQQREDDEDPGDDVGHRAGVGDVDRRTAWANRPTVIPVFLRIRCAAASGVAPAPQPDPGRRRHGRRIQAAEAVEGDEPALAHTVAALDRRKHRDPRDPQRPVARSPVTTSSSPTPTPRRRAATRPTTISSSPMGRRPSKKCGSVDPTTGSTPATSKPSVPAVATTAPNREAPATSGSFSSSARHGVGQRRRPAEGSRSPRPSGARPARPGWPRRSVPRPGRR